VALRAVSVAGGRSYNMHPIAETKIIRPHCGEVFPIQIDTSQPEQILIEDCAVCCRSITLTIRCRPGAIVELTCSL